jgi:uncharacterized damage-inducible protein DinB
LPAFGITFAFLFFMKVLSSAKDQTAFIIKELEQLISKGNAHASFEDAVQDIPPELLGQTPYDLPYSIWQLVEHIRITQSDILEFSRDPQYKSPQWPDGYWPREKAPKHAGDFSKSVHQVIADRKDFIQLLHRSGEGIYTPFPYGDGQFLFREALLIADHTSYHTGEIIVLRRLLKDWE